MTASGKVSEVKVISLKIDCYDLLVDVTISSHVIEETVLEHTLVV